MFDRERLVLGRETQPVGPVGQMDFRRDRGLARSQSNSPPTSVHLERSRSSRSRSTGQARSFLSGCPLFLPKRAAGEPTCWPRPFSPRAKPEGLVKQRARSNSLLRLLLLLRLSLRFHLLTRFLDDLLHLVVELF